ncbi:MAG: substrate-binding domain-containing protein [Dehalococcoidia bacterium]|nr:substrate-binding domain-containing protein [Dehalococcoidia bacterium]
MKRTFICLVSLLAVLSLLAGCAASSSTDTEYRLHDPLPRFRIATTTSLYDTGLWYHLEPIFEEKAGVELDIIYAGTGIALEYGRRGDVDAVIVHDREAEDKFIAEGYGINRRNFGYNFFLIAGPSSDPAGIRGSTATEALSKIYDAGMKNPGLVKFISRGDNSGTHTKEKLIWKEAGFDYEDVQRSGGWYVEAGKGMGPCLLMANEMQGYVLADISTFLAYNRKSNLNIEPLIEQDSIFLNVYAAIAINPEKHGNVKIDIANEFINWLISPEVQEIIGVYGAAEYGRSLFNPIGRGLEDGSANLPGFPPVEDYTRPVP